MANGNNKKNIDKKKEDKLQSIFFISFIVLCIAMIGIMAFRNALKNDKKNESAESSENNEPQNPLVTDLTFYSEDLTEEGKIKNVNARDFVELPDWSKVELKSAAVSKDDVTVNIEDGQKKATRNAIIENCKIKSYQEAYIEDLKAKYEKIYEYERKMLHDVYKKVGEEKYTTVYEYLDVKNKEEYDAFILKSAEEEAKRRLCMQAIIEEYGLAINLEYGEAYCKSMGMNVNDFIEKYGLKYFRQCCIEYTALDYTYSVILKK